MEKRKLQVWLPLLFSITMVAGMFVGYKMRDRIPGKSFFSYERRRPVEEIIDLVNKKYVDKVSTQAITDTAIEALLGELDPHSVFIPASDLEEVNDELRGSFYGIGIEFNIFDDTLHIINVLKDGPGFKGGLKVGDKIISVNGAGIAGRKMPVDSMRAKLKGNKGSKLTLSVIRNKQALNIDVTRDVIPVTSIDAFYMLDSSIGYIRLNKFTTQSYREFMESLTALKKTNLQKLILDLRGNSGGVLDEAVEIADEFLSGDKLITYTEGAHVKKRDYRCRREGQFETGDVVLLIDEGSASASEILAGALQDWDRALIVGRRSFGKGLVQEQFNLSDNSALRLTIARYFTPTGRSIQRPYNSGGKAYYEEISRRSLERDSAIVNSATNGKTFKTRAGKTILSNGGIYPDVYISADSSAMGIVSARAFTKGLINDFGYKYFMQNADALNRYKSPRDFSDRFILDADAWGFFRDLAAKDSIDMSIVDSSEKSYLSRVLKTALARQIWRREGYFEVVNTEDKAVQRAFEMLRK